MTSLSDFGKHNKCKSRRKGVANVDENVKIDDCVLTFVTDHGISQSLWEGRFVELSGACLSP